MAGVPVVAVPPEVREAASLAVLEAFHTLHPRIPGIDKGDCHCNLLAEVALDAVVPVLLTAGRKQAAEAALRDMADRIDRGPAIPLPPSVYSALIRERAADIAEGRSGG